MYYCDTCHVMHKAKPHIESKCDYCGSSTIIKLSKKTDITIEHIDLQSSYKAILSEFYSINNFEPRQPQQRSWNYHSRSRLFRQNGLEYADRRPYGFIYDNISEFMALSRPDLDNVWIKLFGKSSLKYYMYGYVRIKCSLYDHYILVPMSLTTVIDWFNDNSRTYHVVYNKSVWAIEQLSAEDITAPLTARLLANARIQNEGDRTYYNSDLAFIA